MCAIWKSIVTFEVTVSGPCSDLNCSCRRANGSFIINKGINLRVASVYDKIYNITSASLRNMSTFIPQSVHMLCEGSMFTPNLYHSYITAISITLHICTHIFSTLPVAGP